MAHLPLRRVALAGLLLAAACSAPETPVDTPDTGVIVEVDAGDTRTPARLSVSETALDFTSVAVGVTISREVTISNLGEREILLDPAHARLVQVAERPFYNLVPPADRVLKGGEAKVWRIEYTPIFGGRDVASLQLDNDGEITTVTLSGEGIASDSVIVLKSAQATLGSTTSPATSAKYSLEGSVGLGVEAVEMKNADVKLRFGGR